MNTYVEHMCVNICIYMFPSWGNMLETRNPDNITGKLRDLLGVSPTPEKRQEEEKASAVKVLD